VNILKLYVEEGEKQKELFFKLRRMVNAGYTGRDSQKVKKHIEELGKEGIPPPESIPMIYEIISKLIYFDEEIEVIGNKTSGEAEFVLLCTGEDVFIGVGSDHTDRELEKVSIIKSKQICPNMMSRNVWNYEEVKEQWDEMILRGWVKDENGEKCLYQEAPLSTIMSPKDLIGFVEDKLDDKNLDGLIIYSGTVAIITEKIIYSDYFEAELYNPKTNRKLTCAYKANSLNYLIR